MVIAGRKPALPSSTLADLDFMALDYIANDRPESDFASFDAVVFAAGQDVATPDQAYWIDWTPFTYPFNMTRQPAASIPAGLHSNGLPMAAQLVGRHYEDRLVLRAARAIERVRPWQMPVPP